MTLPSPVDNGGLNISSRRLDARRRVRRAFRHCALFERIHGLRDHAQGNAQDARVGTDNIPCRTQRFLETGLKVAQA
jgi:hypothetical protein